MRAGGRLPAASNLAFLVRLAALTLLAVLAGG